MNEIKKKKSILLIEYIAVFLLFLIMYFFVLPQLDVFFFARGTDGSIADTINYSLGYGNGRLLGNIIGVFFSYHFKFASLIIALFLTLLVVLINHIIADSRTYTVFPIAVLIMFPSADLIRDCYNFFPAFCNYVIPLVCMLFAYIIKTKIIKTESIKKSIKAVLYAVMFLLLAGSCLFSENTTIVIACAVLLIGINNYIQNKKIALADVISFVAVALGSLAILLIPKIAGTAYKMSGYRSTVTGLGGFGKMIKCIFGGLSNFSSVFSHCIFLLILMSFAFWLVIKAQKKGKKTLNDICLSVIMFYPVACVAIQAVDSTVEIDWLELVNLGITAVYALAILYTVVMIENPKIRRASIMACVLILSSVAPMMIVNVRGARTFYSTFILCLVFAIRLIKQFMPPVLKDKLLKIKNNISTASACTAAVLSVLLFMQSVYNYDCYVMRSDYLAQRIDVEQQVEIPLLPCLDISTEKEGKNRAYLVLDIDVEEYDGKIVNINSWELSQEYNDKIVSAPFRNALKYALKNYEFKDPLYPQQLREKYNLKR